MAPVELRLSEAVQSASQRGAKDEEVSAEGTNERIRGGDVWSIPVAMQGDGMGQSFELLRCW